MQSSSASGKHQRAHFRTKFLEIYGPIHANLETRADPNGDHDPLQNAPILNAVEFLTKITKRSLQRSMQRFS